MMSFLQWMDNSGRFDPFLLVSGQVDVVARENSDRRDVIEEVFEFYIRFDELENFLDCGLVALIYVASVGPNLKGEDLDSGRGYVSLEVGILVYLFLSSIFCSPGTVSSKIRRVFLSLDSITMSGFKGVTV